MYVSCIYTWLVQAGALSRRCVCSTPIHTSCLSTWLYSSSRTISSVTVCRLWRHTSSVRATCYRSRQRSGASRDKRRNAIWMIMVMMDIFKPSLLSGSEEETFHIVFNLLVVTYVSKTQWRYFLRKDVTYVNKTWWCCLRCCDLSLVSLCVPCAVWNSGVDTAIVFYMFTFQDLFCTKLADVSLSVTNRWIA